MNLRGDQVMRVNEPGHYVSSYKLYQSATGQARGPLPGPSTAPCPYRCPASHQKNERDLRCSTEMV